MMGSFIVRIHVIANLHWILDKNKTMRLNNYFKIK